MDMSEEVGKLVACAGNRLEARTHQSTVGDKAAETN